MAWTRRQIIIVAVAGLSVLAVVAAVVLPFLQFYLPKTDFEPSTIYQIGYPSNYDLGVHTKFQEQYRIWVIRNPERLFVIYARCTHLGCTPEWKPGENRFRCHCCGSVYTSEGMNIEGPAPRPMDRVHIEIDKSGQILVDSRILFSWSKGEANQFDNQGAYIQMRQE